MTQPTDQSSREQELPKLKLFSVSRNGEFVGVCYAKDGVAALRVIQKQSSLKHGGWLAEVVHAAAPQVPKGPEWIKVAGFEVLA
jgi:hypothetical protein